MTIDPTVALLAILLGTGIALTLISLGRVETVLDRIRTSQRERIERELADRAASVSRERPIP